MNIQAILLTGKMTRGVRSETCDKVVAHCDRNAELVNKYSDGISAAELSKNIDEYDEFMVTTNMIKV